jgi:hypothetical protein
MWRINGCVIVREGQLMTHDYRSWPAEGSKTGWVGECEVRAGLDLLPEQLNLFREVFGRGG